MIFTNILELCKESGISVAKLERETGLGNATIRGWSTSSPTVEKLKAVADYFSVNKLEVQANQFSVCMIYSDEELRPFLNRSICDVALYMGVPINLAEYRMKNIVCNQFAGERNI